MRALFICLLTACFFNCFGQEYKYVNADTLALKELPDKNSKTFIFLHAPTKIEVHPIIDKRYLQTPEIPANWYIVRFFINDGTRFGGTTYKGYVEKSRLTDKLSSVNVPRKDTAVTFSYSIPGDTVRHDLRFFKSSRGGCYYVNAAGRKEYVNFCR